MKVTLMCYVDVDEEPMESEVDLPSVPREGDHIRLTDSSQIFPAHVDGVVFSAFEHDRVEVWLSFATYDREEVRSLMDGAKNGAAW